MKGNTANILEKSVISHFPWGLSLFLELKAYLCKWQLTRDFTYWHKRCLLNAVSYVKWGGFVQENKSFMLLIYWMVNGRVSIFLLCLDNNWVYFISMFGLRHHPHGFTNFFIGWKFSCSLLLHICCMPNSAENTGNFCKSLFNSFFSGCWKLFKIPLWWFLGTDVLLCISEMGWATS